MIRECEAPTSTPSTRQRYVGCFLGLALGDAMGAPHEGGLLERLVWRVVGTTKLGLARWTDDTQMALDVANCLIEAGELDVDRLAQQFASSFRWSRGYGPGTSRLLKRIARGESWRTANRSVYRSGSFGNGAAMRAPVIGLYFAPRGAEELEKAARASAEVTHAHPLAQVGAALIARATALTIRGESPLAILTALGANCDTEPFRKRLGQAATWLREGEAHSPKDVRAALGNGIAAADSCVTAIYLGFRFQKSPFIELLAFTIACGGDVDTIGAMAGALWGADRGIAELPSHLLEQLEDREHLEAVAGTLFERACTSIR